MRGPIIITNPHRHIKRKKKPKRNPQSYAKGHASSVREFTLKTERNNVKGCGTAYPHPCGWL